MKDEIVKSIQAMSGKYSPYQIFSDWITMSAISIQNNCTIVRNEIWNKREKQYIDVANKYDKEEIEVFSKMFQMLLEAMEMEIRDWLGEIFMESECGNKNTGQFFTPWHISLLTAESALPEKIEETDLPFEIKAGYDEELKKLCWNVLEGCMNVIKTEETAYDLGKVIDRLKDVAIERRGNNGGMGGEKVVNLDDAIEIVKQVGAGTDDVCEWKLEYEGRFIINPHTHRGFSNEESMQNVYCNTCGKKIKVV